MDEEINVEPWRQLTPLIGMSTPNLNAPMGVSGRKSDNSKIKKYLGGESSIRLKDGMAKTYAWIESPTMLAGSKMSVEPK